MKTQKFAKQSFGKNYECKQDWPDEDIFVQCGGDGVVLGEKSYKTAFFEAFPKKPKTFIRGEGETIEDAEKNCFDKYQKIISCDNHEFVRHGKSEHGNCVKCSLFSTNIFAPIQTCSVCDKKEVNFDFMGDYYCFEHYLNKLSKITSDNIKQEEDQFRKMSLEYGFKEFIQFKVLMEYHLIDTSVDYKVSHQYNEIFREFLSFRVAYNKNVLDAFMDKQDDLESIGKYFVNIKKIDNLMIEKPLVYKNLTILFLITKKLILDKSMQEIELMKLNIVESMFDVLG